MKVLDKLMIAQRRTGDKPIIVHGRFGDLNYRNDESIT